MDTPTEPLQGLCFKFADQGLYCTVCGIKSAVVWLTNETRFADDGTLIGIEGTVRLGCKHLVPDAAVDEYALAQMLEVECAMEVQHLPEGP